MRIKSLPILLFAFLIIHSLVIGQDEEMEHIWDDGQPPTFVPIEPVETFVLESPIRLETIVNDQSEISEVLLYYRFSPVGGFSSLPMVLDVNYTAEIPAEDVTYGKLYHYFWAKDIYDNQATWPVNGEENPKIIPVLSPLASIKPDDITVNLLSPDPEIIHEGGGQIVILSIYDPDENIDLTNVHIIVDGDDITQRAILSRDVITYVPSKLFEMGQHEVIFQLVDVGGVQFEKRFSFSIGKEEILAEEEKESWKEKIGFKGNISVDTDYDSYSGKPQPENRPIDLHKLNARIKFRLGKFKFNFSALLNTHIIDQNAVDKDKRRQPLNRLKFDIRSPLLDIMYGDYSPQFSELTLKGTRVRGLTAQLKLGWWKTTFIIGETKQQIQSITEEHPDSTEWQLIYLTKDSSESTYVSHTKGIATRELSGLRTELDLFRHFNIGISGFRAYDLISSVVIPYTELEGKYMFLGNLVLGTDATLHFNHDKTMLSVETAISVLNDVMAEDSLLIEEGGIKKSDLESIESLLGFKITDDLILGSSEGRGLSIPIPDMDTFNAKDYIWNNMIKKGTYKIQFRSPVPLYFTTANIKAEYLRVPANFASLGNASVQTDIQGLKTNTRMRLWKNQISLSGGYEKTFDNVAGDTKPQTTTTKTVSLGVGLNIKNLPMLNYSIRTMLRTGSLPEGVSATDDNIILNNNETVTHTISPSYKFTIRTFNIGINGNIMLMNYDDANATPEANTNFLTSSYTGSLSLNFPFPMAVTLGGGLSVNTPEDSAQSETEFAVMSGKVSYKFFNKSLNVFAGFNNVDGYKGGELPDAPEIDNQKFTIKFGVQYKFAKNLNIGLNIDQVTVTDFVDPNKNYSEIRGRLKFKLGF
ncbi:MAG: hypothetical protein H8E82_02710 [Candidatus Marinimicrobia bacterium]|nr:hypothetical protein [Candidatus Neomarinimicrobiota bacterium]